MRAAIYETFGNPADVTRPGEAHQPNPGKGEVRIRTILPPIHNHDLWTTRGSYGYKPRACPPSAAPKLWARSTPSARVSMRRWSARQSRRPTAMAPGPNISSRPANGVVPLPDAIGDEAAAQLISMPFSAIALLDALNVKAGDWDRADRS
ncbi:MAG: hypothetical protein MO852_01890 [Candidatus Devosia euplotis]|nr:hypothetical protein [Candidatus Devosia euplotis]